MKILFISFFNGQIKTGGAMCSNRNLKSLRNLFGEENVILYSIKRIERKDGENKMYWNFKNIFIDIFELGFGGLNSQNKNDIIEKIRTLNIDTVFIDSSLLGVLCKKIKTLIPQIKIITFFHNVEYMFFKQNIRQDQAYALFYRISLACISEKMACKYSDKIITLSQRDANQTYLLYQREPDSIIPISIEDEYKNSPNIPVDDLKIGLFVGSYFFANVKGIIWFVQNVLPYVNMKLIIVGQGMDKLKGILPFSKSAKVDIYSYVPNLTEYYEKADFAILPIFLGGGMKVKTAEALMFGKYIIGTSEAFTGYEINAEVGVCCDTSREMVDAINRFNNSYKYNPMSKNLFLKHYSSDVTQNKFRQLMESI